MSAPRGPGRVNPVLASRRVPTSGQDGRDGVPRGTPVTQDTKFDHAMRRG